MAKLRKLVNDCQQRRRTARPGTAGWVVVDIHHAGRLQAELTTLAQGDAALDPGSRHYGQRSLNLFHRLPGQLLAADLALADVATIGGCRTRACPS
jgi:hypothetical protein